MAKFPVEMNDDEGQTDAINYLLSGPAGLGQFFKGYSAYAPGYLTSNYRPPFTYPSYYRTALGLDTEFTITVYPNAEFLQIGMNVTGDGIGAGATISDIGATDSSGTIVTLSVANSGDVSNSIYAPVYFAPATIPTITVLPISLGVSEMIDGNTWKFNFSSTQPSPPFVPGQPIFVTNVDDSYYDGRYSPIGVVECTTAYVIAKTETTFAVVASSNNGTVELYNNAGGYMSTDCNVKVVVTGAEDRVFLTSQLTNIMAYENTDITAYDLTYTVVLNRYVGFINNDPVNPEYRFDPDITLTKQTYTYTGLTGTGTIVQDTNFSSVIDTPAPGYYWYILEIAFDVAGDFALAVNTCDFTVRGLTAQVVKP
jgi:hypothetical protein